MRDALISSASWFTMAVRAQEPFGFCLRKFGSNWWLLEFLTPVDHGAYETEFRGFYLKHPVFKFKAFRLEVWHCNAVALVGHECRSCSCSCVSMLLVLWLERQNLASLANASQEWSVLNDPHMDWIACSVNYPQIILFGTLLRSYPSISSLKQGTVCLPKLTWKETGRGKFTELPWCFNS